MSAQQYDTIGDQSVGLWWREYNPTLPFDAPEGCLDYRIKVRQDEFVKVVMRFADRIEIRTVIRKDGRQMPGFHCGMNFRGKATP